MALGSKLNLGVQGQANSITNASGVIAANAVGSAELAANAVVGSHIAAGVVVASHIGAGQVGSSALAANAVVASNIAAGVVGSSALAANAVVGSGIASGVVVGSHIADATISSGKLNFTPLTSGSMVFSETLSTTTGTASFVEFVNTPLAGKLALTYNGAQLKSTDFTLSGATATLTFNPGATDFVSANYMK